ncbi:hypothetical protein DL771_002675 [Monosporascus sp. 5C6A]|nr:hypothetical protein DL771_002675 [Monosporascus sp. 5C6A]
MALSTLGLLTIGSIPTVIGVAEAIDAQKKQNQQAKDRIKFKLTAKFSVDDESPEQEAFVVFKDYKLYLDHPSRPVEGYRFNGYYFGYPGPEQHQGLVAPIADDPPMLNWIFADKDTGLLRHGSRSDSMGHIIGPWSWTEDEEYLTLEGEKSNFVAVENEDGAWTAHYDKKGDLEDVLTEARQIVDIELHRELQLGTPSGSQTRSGSRRSRARSRKQATAAQPEPPQSDNYDDETADEEIQSPAPRQRRRGQRTQQRQRQGGGGGPLGGLAGDQLLPTGQVGETAGNLVNGATGTLSNVAGGALNKQDGGGGGGKSDTLRLRLDLNLEVEVTLKARIHGDLELALL